MGSIQSKYLWRAKLKSVIFAKVEILPLAKELQPGEWLQLWYWYSSLLGFLRTLLSWFDHDSNSKYGISKSKIAADISYFFLVAKTHILKEIQNPKRKFKIQNCSRQHASAIAVHFQCNLQRNKLFPLLKLKCNFAPNYRAGNAALESLW